MPEPRHYDFDDQLAMSDGVCQSAQVDTILMTEIPGAVKVERASRHDDKHGTDWWIRRNSARPLSVDAKVRSEDWAAKPAPYTHDDLALETWSVVEDEVPGWTRNPKKQTDYVLWLWTNTGRWCLISFPILCKVMQTKWEEWATQYKTSRQFTPRNGRGYHSECIFVPRREVWREIYRRFAGTPISDAK